MNLENFIVALFAMGALLLLLLVFFLRDRTPELRRVWRYHCGLGIEFQIRTARCDALGGTDRGL